LYIYKDNPNILFMKKIDVPESDLVQYPPAILAGGSLLFILLLLIFSLSGCVDMNIKNQNKPDTEDLLGTSADVLKIAGDGYRLWNNAIQELAGPGLATSAMADETTCSWGSAAVKDLSSEPREPFNNSVTYAYAYVTKVFWENSYKDLSRINDILKRIDVDGMIIRDSDGKDVTGMIRGWCYFLQGVIHGYLALLFDQATILDVNTDPVTAGYQPYQEVSAAAMDFFDKALDTLENTGDFQLPDGYISGYNLNKAELIQLINSFAARILAYTPRTAAENTAVDWEKVLGYARNGIDWDLAPYINDETWLDNVKIYGTYPGWARIDHRIINLLDHDYPSRWPDDNVSWNTPDGSDPGEASSQDARLASDFEYLETNNFRPDRGYYHFSHYRYKRYDYLLGSWEGAAPTFLKWENDMLIAEALIRARNDIAGAAALLNDPGGARKVRGGLPDVTPANAKEALEIIFNERAIELILTQSGTAYFDMRRRDMLQAGTPLHFPVPASELEILGLPNYTTDGSDDLSKGCWKGYDGLVSPPGAECNR
jgi:hypothetical protein